MRVGYKGRTVRGTVFQERVLSKARGTGVEGEVRAMSGVGVGGWEPWGTVGQGKVVLRLPDCWITAHPAWSGLEI